MLLLAFYGFFNTITDFQYAERVVLHIEIADFIPNNSELTFFIYAIAAGHQK